MRSAVKRPRPWPPDGSIAILRRFLWLPVIAENPATEQLECRWFEHGTYLAKVIFWENAITEVRTRWEFKPVEWIDTDEQRAAMEQRGRNAYELLKFQAWLTRNT